MVFEKLNKIVEVGIEYTTKSALGIHAGKESSFSAVDQPITRIGGKAVIPGSSIKGVLRSTLESLMSENNIKVCIPEATIPKERMRDKERYARDIGRLSSCEVSSERRVCPICQIFGAAGLSGRAMFLDATPVNEPQIIKRTHVAIDRENKAAAKGSLVELEAVDAGAIFDGKIRVINPEDWQVGALLKAVESLDLLGIGSKKTAGYGEISTKIKYIDTKIMTEGDWKPDSSKSINDFKNAFSSFLKKR